MKTITINEATLLAIAQNVEVLQEFPFIKIAGNMSKKRCGKCRRKAAARRKSACQSVKRSLIGLPPEKAARLKGLLGADEIVVFLPAKQGIKRHVL